MADLESLGYFHSRDTIPIKIGPVTTDLWAFKYKVSHPIWAIFANWAGHSTQTAGPIELIFEN